MDAISFACRSITWCTDTLTRWCLSEAIQLEAMQNRIAISGKPIRFICGLLGGSDVQFSWTKDSNLIVSSQRTEILNSIDGSLLTIRETRANDSGNYTCIAKNLFSEDRATASLFVKGIKDYCLFFTTYTWKD